LRQAIRCFESPDGLLMTFTSTLDAYRLSFLSAQIPLPPGTALAIRSVLLPQAQHDTFTLLGNRCVGNERSFAWWNQPPMQGGIL